MGRVAGLQAQERGGCVVTIRVGDLVRCVSPCQGVSEPPTVGKVYRVNRVERSHGDTWLGIDGFVHGWRGSAFEIYNTPKNPCAEIPVSTMVDWESRFNNLRDASDRLVSENMYLRKELAAERSTKLINPLYVEKLENFKTAVHAAVPRLMNGESGVEACQRVVAENTDLRGKLTALRTAYETLVNSQKVTPTVFDEHKRMKRQLELAESYNFDRTGLTDDEAKRDLYNYVLVALGKKPLTLVEWMVQRLKKLLDGGKLSVWKTPVFMVDEKFPDHFMSTWRWMNFAATPSKFNYPISMGYHVEKPYHQSDAYSQTGCVEGCSHPDCKKDNK